MSPGQMSEADVLQIAREALVHAGLTWREPYRLKRGWRHWRVLTPSDVKGGNAVVYVNKASGEAKVRHYAR
jgi:hypothetical protein